MSCSENNTKTTNDVIVYYNFYNCEECFLALDTFLISNNIKYDVVYRTYNNKKNIYATELLLKNMINANNYLFDYNTDSKADIMANKLKSGVFKDYGIYLTPALTIKLKNNIIFIPYKDLYKSDTLNTSILQNYLL